MAEYLHSDAQNELLAMKMNGFINEEEMYVMLEILDEYFFYNFWMP